jgi:hypothetical protein
MVTTPYVGSRTSGREQRFKPITFRKGSWVEITGFAFSSSMSIKGIYANRMLNTLLGEYLWRLAAGETPCQPRTAAAEKCRSLRPVAT